MKRIFFFLFLVASNIVVTNAQNNSFSYQIQYRLIDVEYTGGDTLYETLCMLNLDSISDSIQQIEVTIGSTQGANDVKSITIPFNNGTQVSMFGNNKGLVRLGNLPSSFGAPRYYSVRLRYTNGSFSPSLEITSTPN